jgi:hypothetical protein
LRTDDFTQAEVLAAHQLKVLLPMMNAGRQPFWRTGAVSNHLSRAPLKELVTEPAPQDHNDPTI